MKRPPPNYTIDEVEALVENYPELIGFKHKLKWLVRACDLTLAFRYMPPKEKQAVLAVGILNSPVRAVSQQLGLPPMTVWNRYRRGLVQLTAILNGRTHKR